VCFVLTILDTDGLNSADHPLSHQSTNKQIILTGSQPITITLVLLDVCVWGFAVTFHMLSKIIICGWRCLYDTFSH